MGTMKPANAQGSLTPLSQQVQSRSTTTLTARPLGVNLVNMCWGAQSEDTSPANKGALRVTYTVQQRLL